LWRVLSLFVHLGFDEVIGVGLGVGVGVGDTLSNGLGDGMGLGQVVAQIERALSYHVETDLHALLSPCL